MSDDKERDARELAWWREVFSCRFMAGNLPKIGTPLLGSRLRIQIDNPEGDWETWPPHHHVWKPVTVGRGSPVLGFMCSKCRATKEIEPQ